MEEKSSLKKNLADAEAVKKFREIIDHESICLFTTQLTKLPLTTRPMTVQKVSDDGCFWFLSAADSEKNSEIFLDARVQLFFINRSDFEFLSVYGEATITRDKSMIDELWTDIAKAWFPGGKDDPRISVIRVTPLEGYYWDTKSGKLVSMIKILASAVTGKTMEEGVEGHATIR